MADRDERVARLHAELGLKRLNRAWAKGRAFPGFSEVRVWKTGDGALVKDVEVRSPMDALDRLDWEILNATADDCENLEQIFLGVAFAWEAGDSQRPTPGCYRRLQPTISLSEVVDHIRRLVEAGLLQVARDTNEEKLDHPSFLWRGWFTMSSQGRERWMAIQPAMQRGEVA